MPAIQSPVATLSQRDARLRAEFVLEAMRLPANDQLASAFAFALSQIFVGRPRMVNARTIPSYHNLLADDAFGNFRQLLNDVSTSPAMGAYLNMLNSNAAPAGQIANENFARELMQLFTNRPVSAECRWQSSARWPGGATAGLQPGAVQAYARALTGWTYANATGGVPRVSLTGYRTSINRCGPLRWRTNMSAKALLSGVTLPAGQTAEQDLSGVIDSIFNHPNVGPFVGRQLIQHLVTGSPSPAYVSRVAGVFANDGSVSAGYEGGDHGYFE